MIEVIIPTLNEAATISNITTVVDEGLQRYFPDLPSRIVSIDSNSTDNTVEKFTNTKTVSDKISLVCPQGLIGKGYGIYEGLKQAQKDDAKYILMLDSDLRSASPEWVKMLIDPLIKDGVGLSAPIYTRNRYEGNGTNHFSSPLIYACFGINFLQPIAGDFAFNRRVSDQVSSNMHNPSDFQYGIDSVITTTTLVGKLRLAQTFLGKKVHNPSFPKIKRIFLGEATSALYILNQSRNSIVNQLKEEPEDMQQSDQRIVDEQFIVKPSEERIASLRKDAELLAKVRDFKEVLGINVPSLSESLNPQDNQELWVSAMVMILTNVLNRNMNYDEVVDCAETLLPLYLLRVVSYFEQIEGLKFQQIDNMLFDQKRAIREELTLRLS